MKATVPTGRCLQIEVTLLEDLHSGTGVSGGALDVVQIRDRRGRPTIRATHVKGLLREAGFDLVKLGLADARNVEALFGTAGNARGTLVMESLRFAKGPTGTLAWTATARALDDRSPLPDTMRTAEFVAAGTSFAGKLELRDWKLEPLLRDCVKRLTALGAYRSRGSGLVTTKVGACDLGHTDVEGEPKQGHVLRLVLVNADPLRLPVTGVPGNLIRTECYIRGQRLRGALVQWAIVHALNVEDLLSGKVDVGNAYPLPLDPEMARGIAVAEWDVIPIPLDCETFKPPPQHAADWPWWAEEAETQADQARPTQRNQKPKRPGDREFLFRKSAKAPWQRYEPRIDVHMRNDSGEQRRTKGRVDETQNLFSTEEIAEDTGFLAEIAFADFETAKRFHQTFAPVLTGAVWLTIGRGGSPVAVKRALWQPAPTRATAAGNLVVRLTSDLIARGPHLGFYDALTPEVLLELAVEDAAERERLNDVGWDERKSKSDFVEVHGFNAASGLPRAAALAIRRGSCLWLTGPAEELALVGDRLATRKALGERTEEGFGRFRLDIPDPGTPATPRQTAILDARIGRREELIREAEKIAIDLVKPLDKQKNEREPSTSQWMALWNTVQAATIKEELLDACIGFEAQKSKLGGNTWQTVCFDLLVKTINDHADFDEAQFVVGGAIRRRANAARNEARKKRKECQ